MTAFTDHNHPSEVAATIQRLKQRVDRAVAREIDRDTNVSLGTRVITIVDLILNEEIEQQREWSKSPIYTPPVEEARS